MKRLLLIIGFTFGCTSQESPRGDLQTEEFFIRVALAQLEQEAAAINSSDVATVNSE